MQHTRTHAGTCRGVPTCVGVCAHVRARVSRCMLCAHMCVSVYTYHQENEKTYVHSKGTVGCESYFTSLTLSQLI